MKPVAKKPRPRTSEARAAAGEFGDPLTPDEEAEALDSLLDQDDKHPLYREGWEAAVREMMKFGDKRIGHYFNFCKFLGENYRATAERLRKDLSDAKEEIRTLRKMLGDQTEEE